MQKFWEWIEKSIQLEIIGEIYYIMSTNKFPTFFLKN